MELFFQTPQSMRNLAENLHLSSKMIGDFGNEMGELAAFLQI